MIASLLSGYYERGRIATERLDPLVFMPTRNIGGSANTYRSLSPWGGNWSSRARVRGRLCLAFPHIFLWYSIPKSGSGEFAIAIDKLCHTL